MFTTLKQTIDRPSLNALDFEFDHNHNFVLQLESMLFNITSPLTTLKLKMDFMSSSIIQGLASLQHLSQLTLHFSAKEKVFDMSPISELPSLTLLTTVNIRWASYEGPFIISAIFTFVIDCIQ
jgi:hypothetical protein